MTVVRNTRKLVLNYFNKSIYSSFNPLNQPNLKTSVQNLFLTRLNSSICWKCGKERKNSLVFCDICNIVQKPDQKENYFKVFELDEKFNIDQQELRNKFRNLQSLLHPDKFSNKSDEEQGISAEYSSLLNKAYNTLQVPLKRAEHLLNLNGEHINEEHGVDDSEFLMEMMELNEEVETAGSDVKKLKELNVRNKAEIEKVSKEIDKCFNTSDIQGAKQSVVKLKYLNSLGKRINGSLRELGETD